MTTFSLDHPVPAGTMLVARFADADIPPQFMDLQRTQVSYLRQAFAHACRNIQFPERETVHYADVFVVMPYRECLHVAEGVCGREPVGEGRPAEIEDGYTGREFVYGNTRYMVKNIMGVIFLEEAKSE